DGDGGRRRTHERRCGGLVGGVRCAARVAGSDARARAAVADDVLDVPGLHASARGPCSALRPVALGRVAPVHPRLDVLPTAPEVNVLRDVVVPVVSAYAVL